MLPPEKKLACDDCGRSLLPNEVCSLSKGDDDLMLCQDCYNDETACPCGCDNDISKCVYRHLSSTFFFFF